jgi:hypothetical protein
MKPRPPRLPGSYPGVAFGLMLRADSQILLALESAGANFDALSIEALKISLNASVAIYLAAKISATLQPDFHAEIKKFSAALEDFRLSLPPAGSALENSLVQTWREMETDFFGTVDDFRREWAFTFGEHAAFTGFRGGLAALAAVVKTLSKTERIGERGKPERRPEHLFIRSLANLYSEYTGQRPTRAVSDAGKDQRSRAIGHFAVFVKAVDDEMQKQLKECLVRPASEGGPLVTMTKGEAEDEAKKYIIDGIDSLIAAVVAELNPPF